MEAKEVVDKLVRLYRENKMSHAYLIETNNMTLCYYDILNVIKQINCPFSYEPKCEKCNLCHLVDELNLPNLIIIEPDGKNIKKESIDSLKKIFNTTSIYTKNNIYVIKYPEKMNDTAFNRMLKFLEEPEDNIIGFFITENKDYVANTIVSRCEIIKCLYNINNIADSIGLPFEEYNEFLEIVYEYINIIEDKKSKIIWYNNSVIEKKLTDRNNVIIFLKILLQTYIEKIKEEKSANKTKQICKIIEKYLKQSSYNINMNLLLNSLSLELGEVYGK